MARALRCETCGGQCYVERHRERKRETTFRFVCLQCSRAIGGPTTYWPRQRLLDYGFDSATLDRVAAGYRQFVWLPSVIRQVQDALAEMEAA